MIATVIRLKECHLSLKFLFAIVAVVALFLASLIYANSVWSAVVGGTMMMTVFAAAIYAMFERGTAQVFALGYLVVTCLYLATMIGHGFLHLYIEKLDGTMTFADTGVESLPTSTLLNLIHDNVAHREYIPIVPLANPNGIQVPDATPVTMTPFIDLPRKDYFLAIGHRVFAMAFGIMAGCFSILIYRRRTKRQTAT